MRHHGEDPAGSECASVTGMPGMLARAGQAAHPPAAHRPPLPRTLMPFQPHAYVVTPATINTGPAEAGHNSVGQGAVIHDPVEAPRP